MVCPYCGQPTAVMVWYPGTVNPAAANPMPTVTVPVIATACAGNPPVILQNIFL